MGLRYRRSVRLAPCCWPGLARCGRVVTGQRGMSRPGCGFVEFRCDQIVVKLLGSDGMLRTGEPNQAHRAVSRRSLARFCAQQLPGTSGQLGVLAHGRRF